MKTYIGKVISNKMKHTVVVEREIAYRSGVFKKIIRRRRRIKAHTKLPMVIGETVKIKETKPISKDTHFEVIATVNRSII